MGIVTDIQRFSLNDGPGIRTTVFLKGCNARCQWCHNPETFSLQPELMIYPDRCFGCGACVDFDSARMEKGLPPPREELTPASAARCFSGALTVSGREMTAEDVMREILQDKEYYVSSGGGVTVSGGECLMQPAFTKEILLACRANDIHTALETNLMYPWSALEELLPLLDLIMADIKLPDSDSYQRYTGIDNAQVLENVARLAETSIPSIIRTPVIPGVNDDDSMIRTIAQQAATAGASLQYYELLNFNPLGASKYQGLNMTDIFTGKKPLPQQRMQELADAAGLAGIPVRIG